MIYESWIKIDTFKMPNGSTCDLEICHARHKAMPELRLSYGYLSEWPVYDYHTDRVLYDHPERFTKRITAAVEKLYRKLAAVHQVEGRACV